MANAIEGALNRASAEQREKAQQVIEEARRNITLVSMRDDITPTDADSISRNAQIIEEAKRNIPFETMQDINTVSPPLPTPSNTANYHSKIVGLHPHTQATIEHIEQGDGNNYLRENAVDRAMARQPQEVQGWEQQQQAIGR